MSDDFIKYSFVLPRYFPSPVSAESVLWIFISPVIGIGFSFIIRIRIFVKRNIFLPTSLSRMSDADELITLVFLTEDVANMMRFSWLPEMRTELLFSVSHIHLPPDSYETDTLIQKGTESERRRILFPGFLWIRTLSGRNLTAHRCLRKSRLYTEWGIRSAAADGFQLTSSGWMWTCMS